MSNVIERLDMVRLLTQVIEYLPKLFAALVVVVVCWLIYRVTRAPLAGLLERAGLHRTLQLFLENIEDRVWQKLAQHTADPPPVDGHSQHGPSGLHGPILGPDQG